MDLDKLEEQVRLANYCFGCGQLNPKGFRLQVDFVDGVARAAYRPTPEDQGFPGVMHGGLVTSLVDELMGWAMYRSGVWAVTAKMELRFRRPVPLDNELLIEAEIEKSRGRTLVARGTVKDSHSSAVLVESEALFFRVPPQEHDRLTQIYLPENWLSPQG